MAICPDFGHECPMTVRLSRMCVKNKFHLFVCAVQWRLPQRWEWLWQLLSGRFRRHQNQTTYPIPPSVRAFKGFVVIVKPVFVQIFVLALFAFDEFKVRAIEEGKGVDASGAKVKAKEWQWPAI